MNCVAYYYLRFLLIDPLYPLLCAQCSTVRLGKETSAVRVSCARLVSSSTRRVKLVAYRHVVSPTTRCTVCLAQYNNGASSAVFPEQAEYLWRMKRPMSPGTVVRQTSGTPHLPSLVGRRPGGTRRSGPPSAPLTAETEYWRHTGDTERNVKRSAREVVKVELHQVAPWSGSPVSTLNFTHSVILLFPSYFSVVTS